MGPVGFILGETRFFAAMRRLLQHPTFINDKRSNEFWRVDDDQVVVIYILSH
jgi:hypothetical protein